MTLKGIESLQVKVVVSSTFTNVSIHPDPSVQSPRHCTVQGYTDQSLTHLPLTASSAGVDSGTQVFQSEGGHRQDLISISGYGHGMRFRRIPDCIILIEER